MPKFITHDDLILLAYNELEPEEKEMVETAVRQDNELYSRFIEILDSKEILEGPSPSSIKFLMEYSRSLSVLKSKQHGNIELILN